MPLFLNNHYDRLYQKPMLERYEIYNELEALAQKIVEKGLLYISADDRCNFVTYPARNGDIPLTFSKRQLYEKELLSNTYNQLKSCLNFNEMQNPRKYVGEKIDALRRKISKYIPVPEEHEIKLARLIVQSAHPSVIFSLIENNVQIFISYAHTISDLLNAQTWKEARYNQGMQSTRNSDFAVFVSCGGNPFFDPKESNNDYDGPKAISRLMIVAAQEIAHYADIIKSKSGAARMRFSSDIYANIANPECNKCRLADMQKVKEIYKILYSCKIKKTFDLERRYRISTRFRKYKVSSFSIFIRKIFYQQIFITLAQMRGMKFVKHIKNRHEIASETLVLCGDMLFNLEPKSLAYLHSNKNIEQAIACAEALARVPQQEVKWGQYTTKFFMPQLYHYYYNRVVPAAIKYYEEKTNTKFSAKFSKPVSAIWHKVIGK